MCEVYHVFRTIQKTCASWGLGVYLGGCLLQEGASFLYAMSMGLPGTECVTQALCKAPGPCDLMEILNSPQSGPVLGSLLLVQFYTIYLKTKKKNS